MAEPTTDRPRRPSPPFPFMRTASAEGTALAHPTPDLQSLQGAYVGNVDRLEESAERLSESQDIGEAIRRLSLSIKRTESRVNSMRSAAAASVTSGTGGGPATGNVLQRVESQGSKPAAGRSRNTSNSSYANSIVDVNSAARWGGYSPNGFVTSPMGSIRSGSWSHASLQRSQSGGAKSATQVTQNVEAIKSKTSVESSLASPELASPMESSDEKTQKLELQPELQTRSSFSAEYDKIASEIQEHFDGVPFEHVQHADFAQDGQAFNEGQHQPDPHDRPLTAASGDTYQQARGLFHDFDGVHLAADNDGDSDNEGTNRRYSLARTLIVPTQRNTYIEPPPGDDMVYYPAPVPRVLNLPKRLSQMPAADLQAKRRTQVLSTVDPLSRQSAAWLTGDGFSDGASVVNDPKGKRKSMDPRQSVLRMSNLPPQLRASVFFDHPEHTQEVQVKDASAVNTLDSILDASAHAPVTAFTDHPFAGHVGAEVYGKEPAGNRKSMAASLQMKRMSTATSLNFDGADKRKSRSSLSLLMGRRQSTDELSNKLRKRSSKLSLATELEGGTAEGGAVRTTDDDEEERERDEQAGEGTPLRHSPDHSDGEHEDDEDEEEEAAEEPEPEPANFGPPTTLLAELQLRKQQQKQRNRTAATAFPNGMHSTLLQLDAVAQIEKQKRIGQRPTLAWEDPAVKAAREQAEEDDDDVPLGVLFPEKNGLISKVGKGGVSDWDRPLGLIAQRELEENEPLSRRRNRLRGETPGSKRDQSPVKNPMITPAIAIDAQESDEEEGETLAQRLRRLKSKEALNSAGARPFSGEFASEMLSEPGAKPEASPKPGASPKLEADSEAEEETLAQRRARLQREREAAGDDDDDDDVPLAFLGAGVRQTSYNSTPGLTSSASQINLQARPPLKATRSMADLLSAHPVGERKISSDGPLTPTGLLGINEKVQARHKAELQKKNKRTSSFGLGLEGPLVGAEQQQQAQGVGKQRDVPSHAPTGGFAGGVYNNGTGGHSGGATPAGMAPAGTPGSMGMANPMMMQNNMSGYFPNMNMMGNMPMGFPQNPHQSMMFGAGGMGMPSPMMNMGMGMNGMNPGMGMGMGALGAGMTNMGYSMHYPMQNPMQNPMQMQMGYGMGMGQELPPAMDSRQRDMIDRWRQSVAPQY